MAIAAPDRAVVTRLKGELRDLLATVGALPRTLHHFALCALRTSRAAGAVAIAALDRRKLVLTRLKGELGDFLTAPSACPRTLHHRARAVRPGIIPVHMLHCSYVLLTHDLIRTELHGKRRNLFVTFV